MPATPLAGVAGGTNSPIVSQEGPTAVNAIALLKPNTEPDPAELAVAR